MAGTGNRRTLQKLSSQGTCAGGARGTFRRLSPRVIVDLAPIVGRLSLPGSDYAHSHTVLPIPSSLLLYRNLSSLVKLRVVVIYWCPRTDTVALRIDSSAVLHPLPPFFFYLLECLSSLLSTLHRFLLPLDLPQVFPPRHTFSFDYHCIL